MRLSNLLAAFMVKGSFGLARSVFKKGVSMDFSEDREDCKVFFCGC